MVKKVIFPGNMLSVKGVAPMKSWLRSFQPPLSQSDGKCDLNTKMTITQKLKFIIKNTFAC
jgi:hypothetical protein